MTKGWGVNTRQSRRFLILFVSWELSKTVMCKSRHLERYPKPCRSNPNPDESKSTNITFSWIWNQIRIPVVWFRIWIRIWMAIEGPTWRQSFLRQVVTDIRPPCIRTGGFNYMNPDSKPSRDLQITGLKVNLRFNSQNQGISSANVNHISKMKFWKKKDSE